MGIYQLDDSLGLLIRKAQVAMHQRLFHNFKEAGLDVTPEQWGIIVRLLAKDGIPQSELASGSARNDSSTTRILDTMSKKGLVERRTHETDRRVNLIYLTEKGLELQKKLVESAQKTIAESSATIADDQMLLCKNVLRTVIENLT